MSINQHTKGRAGARSLVMDGLELRSVRMPLQATTSTTFVAAGVLPPRCLVLDVFIDMASVASAVTPLLDVGTGAASQGFMVGISVASTGHLSPRLVSSARTLGTLLYEDSSGSSSFVKSPAIIESATTVGYGTRSVAARLQGDVVFLIAKL